MVFFANLKCVKGISLEREVGLSPERWWGRFDTFQSGALDCSIPSNPHGNNLGLSCCNAYPPHLWNGFPQDINKHMATDSIGRSACHLWCHFCPYVRVRPQRIGLCQYGPQWLPLSFMTRGNGQWRCASHHGISLCPCVRPQRVVCQRAHTVGWGYLNQQALTQTSASFPETLEHARHCQLEPLFLSRAQGVQRVTLVFCLLWLNILIVWGLQNQPIYFLHICFVEYCIRVLKW